MLAFVASLAALEAWVRVYSSLYLVSFFSCSQEVGHFLLVATPQTVTMVNGIKLRLAMMEPTKSNADVMNAKGRREQKAFCSQEHSLARDSAPLSNPQDD